MMNQDQIQELNDKIIRVLKNIFDPEIPVNIYDLGLIYEVSVKENGLVKIVMTLTTPNCPVAESLPLQVKNEVEFLKGVDEVDLELTFEPPWDQELISDEAKLELGLL